MLNGYIYLLQEREFLKTNEPIYKIGMTEQTNPFDRFNSYPNGSRLFLMRNVVLHVEKHNMTTREIELKDRMRKSGKARICSRSESRDKAIPGKAWNCAYPSLYV